MASTRKFHSPLNSRCYGVCHNDVSREDIIHSATFFKRQNKLSSLFGLVTYFHLLRQLMKKLQCTRSTAFDAMSC